MEVTIKVPAYKKDVGITYNWEVGYDIKIKYEDNAVVLLANKEGLVSLANHLMNLAQEKIPTGFHMHFDENNSLEEGSIDLVIEKK